MSDFEEVLCQLRHDFEARMPARLDALAAALAGARHGDAESEEHLRSDIHRLRGTCATYGLPEVGDHMDVLDQKLETLPEIDEATFAQIGAALEACRALLSSDGMDDVDDVRDVEPAGEAR